MFDHLLDRARGIDLHGVEVVESVDSSGIFGELLAKGVRQVVGRVGGLCVVVVSVYARIDDVENNQTYDEENGFSTLGKLYCKRTGRRGFSCREDWSEGVTTSEATHRRRPCHLCVVRVSVDEVVSGNDYVPQNIHLRESWSRMFCSVGGFFSSAMMKD